MRTATDRGRGRGGSTLPKALAALLAVTAAGCSVANPRHGYTARTVTSGATGESGLTTTTLSEPGPGGSVPTTLAAVGPRTTGTVAGPVTSRTGQRAVGGQTTTARTTAVGVTDRAITVSVSSAFSGVYGAVVAEAYKGWETWRDDVNAHGGIHGRQVIIKTVDGQNTAEGGIAACKEILSNGSFVAVDAGSLFTTGTDCLDAAGYTSLYATASRRLSARWRHSYQIFSGFDDEGATLASFVKGYMGDGDKKLGVVYINQGSFVDSFNAFMAEAKAEGLNVVDVEVGEPNQASFTPQMLRMRDAGAENVTVLAALEGITILRDAKAIGYQPHWTGSRGLTGEAFSAAARDLYTGVRGVRAVATIDGEAFKAFDRKMRAYGRSSNLPGEAFGWYGEALALGKVLEAAGPQPTRESLVSGIESIKGFDSGATPPLTWGPGDYYATEASFPAECCYPDWTWKGTGPPKSRF